ncbi:hypothetical protein BP6252_10058 [Coleophoma cylindrospora]|uniref:Uncharacterized protein n=1 Tax=Coleophoma cylindrospora TaxID=1849047 RepID=A0A3D8QX64_9HELO|nr:hypothetical protein BP6252_10058 [Coleophoma cylindrospora]
MEPALFQKPLKSEQEQRKKPNSCPEKTPITPGTEEDKATTTQLLSPPKTAPVTPLLTAATARRRQQRSRQHQRQRQRPVSRKWAIPVSRPDLRVVCPQDLLLAKPDEQTIPSAIPIPRPRTLPAQQWRISLPHQRIEWPSLNPSFTRHFSRSSLTCACPRPQQKKIQDLLNHRIALASQRHACDAHIVAAFTTAEKSTILVHMGRVLVALYRRARIQRATWQAFLRLQKWNMLSFEVLSKPVGLRAPSRAIDAVMKMLQAFEGPASELHAARSRDGGLVGEGFVGLVLQWLATVIVRGCQPEEWRRILCVIKESGAFGMMNEEASMQDEAMGSEKKWARDLEAGFDVGVGAEKASFGFMLPIAGGVDVERGALRIEREFGVIEDGIKMFFGLRYGDAALS